jgi:thymidylate synthase ThyX
MFKTFSLHDILSWKGERVSGSYTNEIELVNITSDAEFLIEDIIWFQNVFSDQCDHSIECAREKIRLEIANSRLDCLKHASATFRISCSLSCRELLSPNIINLSSENEEKLKYEKETFIYPEILGREDIQGKYLFEEHMKICFEVYQKMMEYGWNEANAGFVLPRAWKVQVFATMNFLEWRKFIEKWSKKPMEAEIRQISDEIFKTLFEKAPSCFEILMKRPT